METISTPSKGARVSGWILTGLTSLFFLVDGIMKIAKATVSMEGSAKLGWPEDLVATIGFLLTIFTILHLIPRTALLGAILITAYLGGAVAIMMRAATPYPFPIVFCVLMWVGLTLRTPRLRQLLF
jgi:hypothetical protein